MELDDEDGDEGDAVDAVLGGAEASNVAVAIRNGDDGVAEALVAATHVQMAAGIVEMSLHVDVTAEWLCRVQQDLPAN